MSYQTLISEYRREFSTYNDVRKYLPERWLIIIGFLFLMALAIGVTGAIMKSGIIITLYIISVILVTLFVKKKIESKKYDRIREYNKKKFIQFLMNRVSIINDNKVEMLKGLLIISNHSLSRVKPSSKLKSGLTIAIVSPLLGYLPSLLSDMEWNPVVLGFLLMLLLMIFGIILMLLQIINFTLNRGYQKELEFRNRIENLLLNYKEEEWSI